MLQEAALFLLYILPAQDIYNNKKRHEICLVTGYKTKISYFMTKGVLQYPVGHSRHFTGMSWSFFSLTKNKRKIEASPKKMYWTALTNKIYPKNHKYILDIAQSLMKINACRTSEVPCT